MGKADYETARRLIALIEIAKGEKVLTNEFVRKKFSVERATAGRYIDFVEEHLSLRTSTRGGRKVLALAPERSEAFARAVSLELALLAMGWLRGTPYHGHLAQLATQSRAAIAPKEQDELDRLVRSFHFKKREDVQQRRHAETISGLITAIRERRVCRAKYQKLDSTSREYVIEPWSIMLISEALYVLARERQSGNARTFELSSMERIKVLEDVFTPPSRHESDPATLLANSIGSYAANYRDPEPMTLRVRGRAEVLLRRRPLHPSQTIQRPSADEWATVSLKVIACPELIAAILSLLPDIRVIGPASLREEVRKAACVVSGSDWDPEIPE